MSARKLFGVFFLTTLLVSVLYPQSLAEIAKKERERRAKLKSRASVVVTNADLAKMKKKPALEIPPAPPEAIPDSRDTPEIPAPAVQEGREAPGIIAPPAENAPPDLMALQEKWEKAKEYVELLTLKMSALWQQYYGLMDAGAKEAVQQAIGETFLKLQKAEEDETLARLELERFLQQQKSESAPPIWIR